MRLPALHSIPASAPIAPLLHLRVPASNLLLMKTSAGAPDWRDDIPNALTMARVAAVPLLALTFYYGNAVRSRLPAFTFAACAITDWLDGFLARKWNVDSAFGAFLDPVADKVLVCTCLVLLSGALGALIALPTAVIVCREVSVSALREWMGQRGERAAVAVGFSGKAKTAAQMVALQLLLLTYSTSAAASTFATVARPTLTSLAVSPVGTVTAFAASLITAARVAPLHASGVALLYIATLLSCTSAAGYFQAAASSLMGKTASIPSKGERAVQAKKADSTFRGF